MIGVGSHVVEAEAHSLPPARRGTRTAGGAFRRLETREPGAANVSGQERDVWALARPFALLLPFSIQALTSLAAAHPHWWEQASLRLTIQMLIPSGHSLTDTL